MKKERKMLKQSLREGNLKKKKKKRERKGKGKKKRKGEVKNEKGMLLSHLFYQYIAHFSLEYV